MSVDRFPRTRALIQDGIEQGLHLGAQLYVSQDLQTLADDAIGEMRPGVPLRRDTLLPWLSAGKPITVLALAQLWEKSLLDLDDPVARFLPEFAANYKESITLRHLLTHTAGLRWTETGYPDAAWEQIIARIAAMRPEPRWTPGHKAGYHAATSWFVLGQIVAQLSEQSFESYVRDHLFVPLGMNDSHFTLSPEMEASDGPRLGVLWDTEKHPPQPHAYETPRHRAALSPGSSARGPIRELGKVYEMLLNRGRVAGSDRVLLTPQTVEALTARHRSGMFDHTFRHVMDWGLGFVLNSASPDQNDPAPYTYGPHASVRSFGHAGAQSSSAFADPENRLVVALIFDGAPGEQAHHARMRPILGAIYEELGLGAE